MGDNGDTGDDNVIPLGRGFPRPTVASQNPTEDQQAAFAYQVSRLTLAAVAGFSQSLDIIIDGAHLAQDERGPDARGGPAAHRGRLA